MKLQRKIIGAVLAGLLLVTAGCSNKDKDENEKQQSDASKVETKFEVVEAKTVNVKQIYGIGYPGNDSSLYIAGDSGLIMFNGSQWQETTTNHHEYIGFQAVQDGFITSGHPEKGTGLRDPLGIVRSTDKGDTVENIAFYGKYDFYFLAGSYTGDGIYVISQQPQGNLEQGVNYSDDGGETWKKSTFQNFNADSLGMLAVHPKNGSTMAVATKSGIYYSTDYGNTVKLVTAPVMVTDVTFNGDMLLFSSVENNSISLKSLNPVTGEQSVYTIPFLDYDNPITYIAVNPNKPNQMAFSTYKNDLFESIDGGKNWTNLLKDGKK